MTPTPTDTATASATASAAAGATSAQMDSVLALLQGLGTVFAVGLGIVILALAWQAVMVSRS